MYILTKNITAGPRIKMVDRYRDDASGPKINLPPHRNFWKKRKGKIKDFFKSKEHEKLTQVAETNNHGPKLPYMNNQHSR